MLALKNDQIHTIFTNTEQIKESETLHIVDTSKCHQDISKIIKVACICLQLSNLRRHMAKIKKKIKTM